MGFKKNKKMRNKFKRTLIILLKRILPFHIRKKLKNLLRLNYFDEVKMIHSFSKSVNVADIMIDVGAHIGGSCEQFLDTGWEVHAFEPDRNNRKALLVLEKEYKNFFLNDTAVSNNNGETIDFYTSEISTGIGGLSKFHPSHKSTYTVETVALKNYFLNENIDEIGFLKIDTEGHDLFVLQGIDWSKVKPEIIICEYEDNKSLQLGYNFNDLITFLQNKNYFIIVSAWEPIIEYAHIHHWKKFHELPHNILNPDSWGNIIAFKDNDLFKKFTEFKDKYTETFSKSI